MAPATLAVDMDEILEMMSGSAGPTAVCWLDLKQGSVVVVDPDSFPADEEDDAAEALGQHPDRYAEIPRVETSEQYDLMCRFTEQIQEEDIQDQLLIALRGKGSFARFRDILFRYPDLRARWYATRQTELLKRALDWFEEIEVVPRYELRSVGAAFDSPAAEPTPRARVELLDLLLLGAPEGKTELIGGRVLRQIQAKTPSEARFLFKSLARQLCEFHGVAWRKRFAQGRDTFEMGRSHLRVAGHRVELYVEVSMETWDAFT